MHSSFDIDIGVVIAAGRNSFGEKLRVARARGIDDSGGPARRMARKMRKRAKALGGPQSRLLPRMGEINKKLSNDKLGRLGRAGR